MKVIPPDDNTLEFKDVPPGDVFRCNVWTYIKMNPEGLEPIHFGGNALCLNNGVPNTFPSDAMVERRPDARVVFGGDK